jgi:hypothetical protein
MVLKNAANPFRLMRRIAACGLYGSRPFREVRTLRGARTLTGPVARCNCAVPI